MIDWERKLNAFQGYHEPISIGLMVAGSLASAAIASDAAGKASKISAEGTKAALSQKEKGMQAALDRKQKFFDIAQEQSAPYREIGVDAVKQLNDTFINGNMDNFFESAGYKFNLSEGQKALDRKQGASGSRYGGRALKEATQYAQGVASNEFSNYFNRINSIAAMGANATANSSGQAINTGNSMGNTLQAGNESMANTIQTGSNQQAQIGMDKAQNINNSLQAGLGNLTTLKTYNDMKTVLGGGNAQVNPVSPTTVAANSPSLLSRDSFNFKQ